MSLVTFATATTATGAQLDNNFAELGQMATTPCGVTGTDVLSLTPLTGTPDVNTYVNYQSFSGIASGTNTGPVTAGVGSLASINVFKDTSAGPVALAGGEITAGNFFTLTYDASLGGAGGGFHLQTGVATAAGTYLPLTGGTLSGELDGTIGNFSGSLSAAGVTSSGAVNGVSLTGVTAAISGGLRANSVNIGAGAFIMHVRSTSVASVVYATILPNASADQSIAFANVATSDTLMMGLPSLVSTGVSFNAFASTSGTVTLRAFNVTTGTITGLTLTGVRLTAMQF